MTDQLRNVYKMTMPSFGGAKGTLTAIEGGKDIPFEIRRIYYITGVPEGVIRGFHAHRELKQILFCLNGSVKIRVKTPDQERIYPLKNPSEGLFIGSMIWREMLEFSPGAVLMVLASEYYAESDYIRDYGVYLTEAKHWFSGEGDN
jgi:dTDP-4-dehydrorhamnose 3,5-epimerase-like enzyme